MTFIYRTEGDTRRTLETRVPVSVGDFLEYSEDEVYVVVSIKHDLDVPGYNGEPVVVANVKKVTK